jgi:hypothetical protein
VVEGDRNKVYQVPGNLKSRYLTRNQEPNQEVLALIPGRTRKLLVISITSWSKQGIMPELLGKDIGFPGNIPGFPNKSPLPPPLD